MKKRSLISLAILCFAAIGGLLFLMSRSSREPVYEGRRLSEWTKALDYYNRGQPGLSERDARRALREAGTNAIPTLLRMLQATDSPLKVRLMNLLKQQHFISVRFNTAESRRRQAEAAFGLLGPRAAGAVPELIKIYSNSPPDTQAQIAQMLGNFGPLAKDAAPLLRRAMSSTNLSLQINASNAVQNIVSARNSYDPVGQSLMTRLNDHLTWQQAEGARMIFAEGFGSPAHFANFVPVIEGLLRQNRENSYWLLFALDYLDPQAAAKFMTNTAGASGMLHLNDPADDGSGGMPGARLLGAGDWSHALADGKFNKLRARLLVYGPTHYTNHSGEWWGEPSVEIELMDCNIGLTIAPTAIYFDGKKALQLELRDAQGKVVAPTSSHGDTNAPQWISVPFDGTVRFRIDAPVPASHAKPDGLSIQFGGDVWHISSSDMNTYVLSGTLAPTANHSNLLDYQVWSGTLDLPEVKFSVPKP